MSVHPFDLLIFLFFCAFGWALLQLWERHYQNERQQIREHLTAMLDLAQPADDDSEGKPDLQAVFQHQQMEHGRVRQWFDAWRKRLLTVTQGRERLYFIVSALLSVLVAGFLLWAWPGGHVVRILLLLATPPVVLTLGYRIVAMRFRKRFLAQFPNALDLIIRAVRAGVPASHAIAVAGQEFAEPLRTQFSTMGDGLQLGIDLGDVLKDADRRIDLPEFSFFCVCLLLQRETGGPLTETLENLAQIIRSRSEMALKARALTAEVRAASKVMALIPPFVAGVLWMLNPDYIAPLFNTPAGLTVLKLAIGLVAIGLGLIWQMSNMRS
jgi:Flp pilus assembly protein TadB